MANPEEYLGHQYYDQIIGGHRQWLAEFSNGEHPLDKWDRLFKHDDTEAALCEALTREVLQEWEVEVEPYDLGSGNMRKPDFRCYRNANEFYVEVTCITKKMATAHSGLDDIPKDCEAGSYRFLTIRHFQKADKKVGQFQGLNAPCLLAIGTLHFSASQLCFDECAAGELLTSAPQITVPIDTEQGKAVGKTFLSTDLWWSVFLKRSRIVAEGIPRIRPFRQEISGILLCPYGVVKNPKILGILHPQPFHPFDRSILPAIPFCKLQDGWQDGRFEVEWV